MIVYPVEGRRVRDPQTRQILPDAGREVPDHDAFWLRALRDGDVTTRKPPAPPEAAPAAAPAAETHHQAEPAQAGHQEG